MKTAIVLGAAYGGERLPFLHVFFVKFGCYTILLIGSRAAQILAAGIPKDWKILLIDRNSCVNILLKLPDFSRMAPIDMQIVRLSRPSTRPTLISKIDVYVLPRFSVLPGHEHKACR